jgi:hypothetical protein
VSLTLRSLARQRRMKQARRVIREARLSWKSDVPLIVPFPPRRAVMSYNRPFSFLTGLERAELEEIRLNLDQKIFRIVEA